MTSTTFRKEDQGTGPAAGGDLAAGTPDLIELGPRKEATA